MPAKQRRPPSRTSARLAKAGVPAPSRAIVARVRRFIIERHIVRPGDRVLVAVSGGADSTCLLIVLAALRRSLDIELLAAHFDHMLRGRHAAQREQAFVADLCARLDVALHSGAADVRGHKAKKRISLEEAARELRYAFLARTARKYGCVAVATGHTQDDQAETVLLHIIRGAGLRGQAGMAPSGPLPVRSSARLIRPILSLSRADTEHVCREAWLEPLEDPTNRSSAHLRNRVRHQLLPLLRAYNPRIERALARLAAAAAVETHAVEALATVQLATAEASPRSISLRRADLTQMPEQLRGYVILAAARQLLGDARSISERNISAIVHAADGPTGSELDLPRQLHIEVQREVVVMSIAPPRTPLARRVQLSVPGRIRFGPWTIQAQLLKKPPASLASRNGVSTALLDAGAVGPSLWLRPRRPGDRYQPLGLRGQRKLQDVLVDAHVPRSQRDSHPLVCCPRGIAWVAGRPPAEWAKVTRQTKRVIRIKAVRHA